jgi:hypothetical protein
MNYKKILKVALIAIAVYYGFFFLLSGVLMLTGYYSFGVLHSEEVDNFSIKPVYYGEEESGISFQSTLMLPNSDHELELSHFYFYPPLNFSQEDMKPFALQKYENDYFFTNFRLWGGGSIESIEVTNKIDGDVLIPELQVIYYSGGKELENSLEIVDSFNLDEEKLAEYGFTYFLAYPTPQKSSLAPKFTWFKGGQQLIKVTYYNKDGELQSVEYDLSLDWRYAGSWFEKLMWSV